MKKLIIVLLLLSIIICFAGCGIFDLEDGESGEVETNDKEETGFYLGETMSYEDIDITVNSIKEDQNYFSDSDNNFLTVSLTLKNNKKKAFQFNYKYVYIKTEDKGEKYNYAMSKIDLALGYDKVSIVAGGTQKIEVNFIVPYTLNDKHFRMYFYWGLLNREQEYHLYSRPWIRDEEESLISYVKGRRELLYLRYENWCYNAISEDMNYEDVDNLISETLSRVKKLEPYGGYDKIIIGTDLTSGSNKPKWILQHEDSPTRVFNLFYIEVEFSDSGKVINKSMDKYEIV